MDTVFEFLINYACTKLMDCINWKAGLSLLATYSFVGLLMVTYAILRLRGASKKSSLMVLVGSVLLIAFVWYCGKRSTMKA